MRFGIFCSVLGLLVLSGLPAAGAGREPVPLNDYARLGQRFTANQPFSALSVIVPSWMDAEGGLTLTLWESPQRGRLIVQQVFTAIPDNAGIELLIPASQPPGVYYWEIGERTGQTRIGLYADRLDADTEDCAYVDGVPDPRRRFLFSTPVPPFAYTDPARMLAILDSGAPLVERQEACRLLAVMGGRDAIPVLARLLADPQLSHLARYALEPMPEAAVDAAFRAALQALTGALRVGVINSIGVRRDVKAVAPLSACLRDPDAAVAAAAAAALGRIGTAAAAKALAQALPQTSASLHPAFWDACLDGAAQLAAAGHRRRARAIYDTLCGQETSVAVRLAAVRGAIVTRGGATGVALLLEQLRGTDPVAVSAALWVAQNDAPGTAVSAALAAGLPTLPEHRQVALTQALGSRADPAAVAALLVLARSGGKAVRLAAIRDLPRCRGAAAVLVDLLEDPDADIAAAAQSALADWPDPAPDSALVARLDTAIGTQRLAAIQLVGARGLPAAVPGLLRLARDPDPASRLAALRVLADLAGADDLPALLELLPAGAAPEEREALERALRTACGKAANPAACTGMLVRLLPKAEPGITQTLLRLLHGLGGEPACLAVLAATGDGNADLSALAYRLLGEWRTPEAVPHLLRLAGTSPQPTARLLCLRGCIRLAGSPETPVAQKLDLCRRLVPLAQREEEKKLLLGVLAGLPGPEALALTRPYLDESATRAEAGAALLAIAEPLLASPAAAPAREALQALARSAAGTDQARRAEALLAKGAGSPAGN